MPSSTLSPILPLEQNVRPNSFAPSENESVSSYENPGEAEYQNQDDEDEEYEPGVDAPYIDVLPGPPVTETRQSNQSLASTQSSEHPYVNIEEDPVCAEDYQNVNPLEDSDEDSDSETGNYVNQDMICITETSIWWDD